MGVPEIIEGTQPAISLTKLLSVGGYRIFLIKLDRIIAAVNSCVRRTTHEYFIEVPTSVDHAKLIDAFNGNRFCQDAIDKDMTNVAVKFEILDEGKPAPIG